MSATNQNIQLKSYSWNVRTKTGVTAFFDIDMRKHVFSGQRGARLPTGCANESGKIKAKYNRGRNECKEEAVEKKTLWEYKTLTARGKNYCETRREREFTLGSRQSRGHLVVVRQVSASHTVGRPPQETEDDWRGWQGFLSWNNDFWMQPLGFPPPIKYEEKMEIIIAWL